MQTNATVLAPVLSATIAIALLTGCAVGDPERQTAVEDGPGKGMPDFSGSFAAEYQEAWEKSSTEDVKTILKDEQITDQEWSQVLAKLEACLEDNAISMVEYKTDGSYEVTVGDMEGDIANQRMGACEQQSGEAWVGYLYRSQTSNPENVPATQLLTECLIRNEAVSASYTEEQYLLDAPGLSFPFVDEHGFKIFESCNADFSFTK